MSQPPVNLDDAGPPVLAFDGRRASVRLRRPQRHNALSPHDIATFVELLGRVESEPGVRVLVLSGDGPTFCSGFDLGALAAAPPNERSGVSASFAAMVDRLEALRVPTIGALGGGVYGGGCDLALACDFRIGTPAVSLRMSAGRIGVHYYATGMSRFVSRLGLGAAKRLFLLAETLDAPELLRIGYLDEVVTHAALAQRVDELAASVSANGPAAVQGMKRALNALARGTADVAAIDAAAAASLASPDVVEGLAALREKRPPRFADPF